LAATPTRPCSSERVPKTHDLYLVDLSVNHFSSYDTNNRRLIVAPVNRKDRHCAFLRTDSKNDEICPCWRRSIQEISSAVRKDRLENLNSTWKNNNYKGEKMVGYRMRKYVIGFTTLLTLSLMFSVVAFSPVYAVTPTPHQANAMWVEPPVESYSSSTPVGTKFNVTIWLNVTVNTNSWQFFLVYNHTILQALRCDYTGIGKSQWSGSKPVYTVFPSIMPIPKNASYAYVLHGEVLQSSDNQTGAGSLSWVEFNITYVPPAGISIHSVLLLDQTRPATSYALDAALNDVTPKLTFDKCNYFIPEFPLPTLLVAFFAVASVIVLIFRRTSRQKMYNRHSCRL
jgi:hypothetical protein